MKDKVFFKALKNEIENSAPAFSNRILTENVKVEKVRIVKDNNVFNKTPFKIFASVACAAVVCVLVAIPFINFRQVQNQGLSQPNQNVEQNQEDKDENQDTTKNTNNNSLNIVEYDF